MEQSNGEDVLSKSPSTSSLDVGCRKIERVEQAISRMVDSLKEIQAMTPGTPQKAARQTTSEYS